MLENHLEFEGEVCLHLGWETLSQLPEPLLNGLEQLHLLLSTANYFEVVVVNLE